MFLCIITNTNQLPVTGTFYTFNKQRLRIKWHKPYKERVLARSQVRAFSLKTYGGKLSEVLTVKTGGLFHKYFVNDWIMSVSVNIHVI